MAPGLLVARQGISFRLVSSYVFDWLVLVAAAVVGYVLGNITPNKRHFYVTNPDISFPFTTHETVTSTTLVAANTLAPMAIILVVALIFVPGPTVPPHTPRALIWRRKLWEWHIGWLGLALSVVSAWLITNGMKNLFGKPRPDLLARCDPDLDNINSYVVGGVALVDGYGQLVSAGICRSTDSAKLDDGFRSFPSGHSSSSAAGLLYLTLFLASKFAVTIPFLAPASYSDESSYAAFPSRSQQAEAPGPASSYEGINNGAHNDELFAPAGASATGRVSAHNQTVNAARRQAAAPPVYLLVLTVLPFFTAIFIASSRWFDFRHHGFDILFGFMIGTLCAVFAFRYYHLPINQGAGWAWGPRSHDKAFWAGVGSYSYATCKASPHVHVRDFEEEIELTGGRSWQRGR